MNRKPALLFYCQHSVGVGHLIRSFSLAEALAEDWHVILLNGGRMPAGINPPAGVEIVQLHALGADDDGELVSHTDGVAVEQAKQARREQLLDCLAKFAPRVIVIELFPFGRKKFADEILALLERAAASGQPPLVLCSLRDVLVSRKDQERYDERAAALVNRHFHGVLVHSDPAFARLEDSFHARQPLQVPLYYTGFVARARTRRAALSRERRVLVSSGGGLTGRDLFRAALPAHRLLWQQADLPMTVIAGPFLGDDDWRELASAARDLPGLTLQRTVPDVGAEMEAVSVSASRCGYNTTLDILYSGVPALVIPFGDGHEDEQRKRARRLETLGILRVLDPGQLDGPTLAREIRALETFRPDTARIDLNGALNSARRIGELSYAVRARRVQA